MSWCSRILEWVGNRRERRTRLVDRACGSVEFDCGGDFLIASKRGLFRLQGKRLSLLLRGNFYGTTLYHSRVFVFQRLKPYGRILLLNLSSSGEITSIEVYAEQLSPGCHQIDVHLFDLYICDSYNNCIQKRNLESSIPCECYYPLGESLNGRDSDNYGHINSIYVTQNHIVALCHNRTQYTNRTSQILVMDSQFAIQKTIETPAGSAHNVVPFGDSYLYCDSMNGNLNLGNETVFEAGSFTRGLSVTENYILLGGGEYSKRQKRRLGKGYLYILDSKTFELLHQVMLPSMVQEIRRIDGPDFGLSQWNGRDKSMAGVAET